MPATGLKIVGTGACLPWCSISSSFQNSLKMSGHRGYEFLEFRFWILVPFLPVIGFQLLKSLWSSLAYFSFNDAGRSIQHPDSSTMKQYVVLHCPAEIHKAFHEIDVIWRGAYVALKPCIYLSAFIVPSKTSKLPIPYALMDPHTIRETGFWNERGWHAGRSPSSLALRTQNPWFPTRTSNLDSSDHRTLFHFETVHCKWDLAHRTWQCFWTMFTFGPPFCMI